MKKILFLLCNLFIFSLTGCALYTKPKVPCVNAPGCFQNAINTNQTSLNPEWWKNFQDPQLNNLVDLAICNNYNYLIALKNIQIAYTYVTQNISNLFPQINANAGASRNKVSPATFTATNTTQLTPFDLYQLGGTVSYQVDLWNQIGNTVNQARADLAASKANSDIIKLTLITNVVQSYFQIVSLNSNLANLNAQWQAANELVDLIQAQFTAGLVDAQSLDTAKNQQEVIKSNIDILTKQREILKYTLAYLIGEYPECFSIKIPNVLVFRNIESYVPRALPACMIANRPDIQQAYYQILSYGYIEKQNIANFLPNIQLTGDFGYASNNLAHLVSRTTQYWSYGVFVTQFIFDYKYRLSIYMRSKYQYQSSILNYRNILLNAFQEVNTALISYKEDNNILSSYNKQEVNFQDLLKIAQAQYQGGLVDYSSYLNAYLNQQQNAFNITNQQVVVIQDVVQIYKSLGLGLNNCK